MPTPYSKIYDSFLPKLRSYDINMMDDEEVEEYLQDYLKIAISNFHVCTKDLYDFDDDEKQFNIELSPVEIEILSNYMLLSYIDSTYVRTPSLLKANLSSSDFNSFSNANQLAKLTEMQTRYRGETEALVSRYSWLGAEESGDIEKIKSGYLR